ncbi:MAG: multidrug transporter [Lachnospiraceae bacterium]|nr:multidrug transporter [Lachnospiraceae bacterium]
MPMVDFPEKDWKLFRKRIVEWQEAYMDKLCKEYVGILSESGSSAERFWTIEKRIKVDKRKVGVNAEMRRSMMYGNILALIQEGAITLEDLDGFSDELRQAVESSTRRQA